MFITDAHLDMGYNIINKHRDVRLPLADLRAAEPPDSKSGIPTVSFPAMRDAGVGLVFATIYNLPQDIPFDDEGIVVPYYYKTPEEAHKLGMMQVDAYRRLIDEEGDLRLVTDGPSLYEVVASHGAPADGDDDLSTPLIGLTLLMEGADHIRVPEETELWYDAGVRLIGPAWDDTRYCAGAWRDSSQGLTKLGYALLEQMSGLNMILDVTHMSEVGVYEALDRYEGRLVATHANARALVPGERQLNDEQIRLIAERDGVIGAVLFNTFIRPGWRKGDPKELVTLDQLIDHIDHICQVIGDADHVGIGSDLDGGLGADEIPTPLDSIADLPLIAGALAEKGYETADIEGIMGLNWVRLLRETWG